MTEDVLGVEVEGVYSHRLRTRGESLPLPNWDDLGQGATQNLKFIWPRGLLMKFNLRCAFFLFFYFNFKLAVAVYGLDVETQPYNANDTPDATATET